MRVVIITLAVLVFVLAIAYWSPVTTTAMIVITLYSLSGYLMGYIIGRNHNGRKW